MDNGLKDYISDVIWGVVGFCAFTIGTCEQEEFDKKLESFIETATQDVLEVIEKPAEMVSIKS